MIEWLSITLKEKSTSSIMQRPIAFVRDKQQQQPHTHNVLDDLSRKLYLLILLWVSAAYTLSEFGWVAMAWTLIPSQLAVTDPSID